MSNGLEALGDGLECIRFHCLHEPGIRIKSTYKVFGVRIQYLVSLDSCKQDLETDRFRCGFT